MAFPSTKTLPAPLLVIDGSGTHCFTGVLDTDGAWMGPPAHCGTPLERLFVSVKKVLAEASVDLHQIRGYIYCEGPGSVLGLRLAAMALETWSRLSTEPTALFSYNSLQLTAAGILIDNPNLRRALLIADWKKGAWNAVWMTGGKPQPTTVVETDELLAWDGPLYHLPQRKGWQSPPEGALTVDYPPLRLPEMLDRPGLLTPTTTIRLPSAGTNTFRKWTADRHRADVPADAANGGSTKNAV